MNNKWYGRTDPRPKGGKNPSSYDYTVTITNGTADTAVLRKSGCVVSLNLTLFYVNAAASWTTVGKIPLELAPDHDVGAPATGAQLSWLRVTSDGTIEIYASPANASMTARASLTWVLLR